MDQEDKNRLERIELIVNNLLVLLNPKVLDRTLLELKVMVNEQYEKRIGDDL